VARSGEGRVSPEWIQAGAELGGTLLVPFAVYFAALQWRLSAQQSKQLREAVVAEIQQSLASQFQQLATIMIEYPGLRKYFYSGAEPPESGPELERASVLAGMFMDFVDTTVVQKAHMPQAYFDEWRNYFVDLHRASPLIQRMSSEWADFYGPEVAAIFDVARERGPRDHLGVVTPPVPAAAPLAR
jgi:hypothetical protein